MMNNEQSINYITPSSGNAQQYAFQQMVENSLDIIIKVSLSGHYTYVNPTFCHLYGMRAEDLLGRHYAEDVVEEDREMVNEFFNKLFTPPYTVRFVHRENTINGVRRLEWSGKGLMNAQGELAEFVGVARDVTDRLDLIDQLAEQAYHDDLTGLANRRFLIQHAHIELERIKRYHYPLSLLMVDIDHFKMVNDQHGHPAGDAILKQLSSLMRGALREHDLVARIGGEEFAVLLHETSLETAIIIAEKLRVTVEKNEFSISKNLAIPLTISIGIATAIEVGNDFEKLMQQADSRLYHAKSHGRNQTSPASKAEAVI